MTTNYALLILAKQILANTVEKQIICKPSAKKRKSDFSALQKNSINRYYEHLVNNLIQTEPNSTNLIKEQESSINSIKKREKDSNNQSEDSNQFSTQSQYVVLSQNEDSIEDCIKPVKLNANLQMDLTGTFDDVVSQSFDNYDKNNENNWWYMSCKIECLSCKTENLIKETSQSFLCLECDEEQQVAQPCCEDETSLDRFPVKVHEQFTDCVKCKSEIVRLPCCKQFQPKLTKEKYLYDCVQCSKYSFECACNVINILPPKSMKWRCLKPSSSFQIVHCECGKISSEKMKERIYKYNCEIKFEYDIDFGVKLS